MAPRRLEAAVQIDRCQRKQANDWEWEVVVVTNEMTEVDQIVFASSGYGTMFWAKLEMILESI